MNNKAQGMMMGMMGPRKPISLLLGLAFIVLGLLPLLNQFGVVGFSLPVLPAVVIYVLAIIGALFLFWDAISEQMSAIMGITQQVMFATFIVGLIALAFGLIPLLYSFGVIGFSLPTLGETIINILFTAVGTLLLFGGTQGV
jgi:hypothetical protein